MSAASEQTSQVRPPVPQRRDEPGMRNFGMVVFDDTKNPGAAWCAVNGGDPKRVEGTNQLSTDTLWWTNLSYEEFFMTTEANRNPWLRHDAYMIAKPKDALVEWDLDPATTPPDYLATFCSAVFARVMTLSYKMAKDANPNIRMTTLFKTTSLREDLRFLLPKADFPEGEAAAIMKAGQAYSNFTKTAVRRVRGGKQIMLRRPRIPHALEMLTTPMPQGPFEFKSRADLRTLSSDRVSWVRSTDRPCMVEVTVDSMQQDVAPIYGFGNSTDRDRRIPRSWIAHPEFLMMSSFSDLQVRSAWIGKDYGKMNLLLPPAVTSFLSDSHIEASWSAGIIAENLWRAACLGTEKRWIKGSTEERPQTSWRGAWIMAADKAAGFMSAMRLTDMGYAVPSYGNGWVLVEVTDDQMQDLLRDGLSIGLIPRLFDVPAGAFPMDGDFQWGGDKKSRILATLTVTKQKTMMWNLDRLPLYEGEQRAAYLRKMMEHNKRSG